MATAKRLLGEDPASPACRLSPPRWVRSTSGEITEDPGSQLVVVRDVPPERAKRAEAAATHGREVEGPVKQPEAWVGVKETGDPVHGQVAQAVE